MNSLLIITGIIFLICGIYGASRGFIKIVASLAATIVTILCGMFLSPYVSRIILEVTPLEETMQTKCAEILKTSIQEHASASGIQGIEKIEKIEEIEKIEFPREMQISLIENANLPKIFKETLLENNNSEIYQALGVSHFSEYVGSYLARTIANYAGFLITMLIVTIIVRIAFRALGVISELPIIGGVNRVAGCVLGLAIALVVVWLLFILVTLLYNTAVGKICLENIGNSRILSTLYENNILMNFITKFNWGRG